MDLTVDFAEITPAFEQKFRYFGKETSEVIDGYVEEKFDEDQCFRGVFLPRRTWSAMEQGARLEGESFLIVRSNQDGCPDIQVGDKIVDPEDVEWRVVDIADYNYHGKAKVYGITRLTTS